MTPDEIAAIFSACFSSGDALDRARMVRGGDEPLYLPASRHRPYAEIVYARGLSQSCLHEASHWLRAGRRRRQLVDYGYWYLPDGRDAAAQLLFESNEVEVQALERVLAWCAGVDFVISCDNLVSPHPSAEFVAGIESAFARRLRRMSGRMLRFAQALCHSSGRNLDELCEIDLAVGRI